MKKKILLIILMLALVAAAIITSIVLLSGDKKEDKKEEKEEEKVELIVINFETDGGSEVEKIEVEKGKEVTLPATSKDGYTFLGWYNGEEKIEDTFKAEKDLTLTAKWEKIPEKAKTYTITFDSKGGTKVSSIQVECGKTVPSLPTPKRDGYKFVSWGDKNGKVILKGANLTCANVTLYANWEEVKKEETKKYTCPDGYTLNGTKCTMSEKALTRCPGDTYEYLNGVCITLTYSARKDPTKTCGKTTVHTGGGHTEEVTGEFFQQGAAYCYFKVVTTSDEQNQNTCNSRGHKWNSSNNKCYYYRGDVGQFVNYSCESNYQYLTTEQANSLRQNANMSGCFPTSSKYPFCETGWELSGSTCTKTIDATLE